MFGFKVTDIQNPWDGAAVYFRDQTASTMNAAERFADHDAPTGTVVAAGSQTGGRGRRQGRVWLDEPGKNLLFTLLISREAIGIELSLVPIMVGFSISSIIKQEFGLPVTIKWPNDVLIGEQKCAGVLCSVHKAYVLIGIGINCNQQVFPDMPGRTPTSIAREYGSIIDSDCLLSLILREIYRNIGEDGWLREFHARLYRIGESIRFLSGDPEKGENITGILTGVDAAGCLILSVGAAGELCHFASGEIVET